MNKYPELGGFSITYSSHPLALASSALLLQQTNYGLSLPAAIIVGPLTNYPFCLPTASPESCGVSKGKGGLGLSHEVIWNNKLKAIYVIPREVPRAILMKGAVKQAKQC